MIELAVICGLITIVQGCLLAWMMADRRKERQEVRAERADLLQRISAPEYAAVQHYNDHTENQSPPAVEPDVDEDYWLSKDDLARVAAQEEMSGD